MVEDEIVVSINGHKASTPTENINFTNLQMHAEAAALLELMQSQQSLVKKLSDTSPDLKSVIEQETNEKFLVRSRPEMLQLAIDQRNAIENLKQEIDPVKKLMIHESGVALGIIVGKTTKHEAFEIMASQSKTSPEESDPFYYYSDITVSIFFDEENIVREIKFGNKYKGYTLKGLSIGDGVQAAIELYGQPKLKSPKGAIWERFAIFCENNVITSIRIQK